MLYWPPFFARLDGGFLENKMIEIVVPIFFLVIVISVFFLIGEISKNIRERRRDRFYGSVILNKKENRWRN